MPTIKMQRMQKVQYLMHKGIYAKSVRVVSEIDFVGDLLLCSKSVC